MVGGASVSVSVPVDDDAFSDDGAAVVDLTMTVDALAAVCIGDDVNALDALNSAASTNVMDRSFIVSDITLRL